MENQDPLTEKIIGCCYKVHNELWPGFNEKIYHKALLISLKDKGLSYQTEKEFVVVYGDKKVGSFRLDLIIEEQVIVEIKAFASLVPDVFKYQILSYLKVSGLKVGLIVNFGNKSCWIKRFMV